MLCVRHSPDACAASLCPSLPFDELLLWTRFVKKKDAMTEMAEALGAHRAKEFNLGKNPNRLGGCPHAAQ